MDIGDAPHKTFCKEVSGKKVVDLFFHKVRAYSETDRVLGNPFGAGVSVVRVDAAFLCSLIVKQTATRVFLFT